MRIITITGRKNSGKTSLLNELLKPLQTTSNICDGFIAIPFFVNGKKSGFDILRILSKEIIPLCRKNADSALRTANYSFYESNFNIGSSLVSDVKKNNTKVVFLDEIGVLELRNEGWYNLINTLLALDDVTLLLTFRKNIYDKLIEKFSINPILAIDLDNTSIGEASNLILDKLIY